MDDETAINKYKNLVFWAVKKYRFSSDYDDILQEAWLGLISAARKFDSNRNVKFTSYATKYINGYIARWFRDQSRTIRLPAWFTEQKLSGPCVTATLEDIEEFTGDYAEHDTDRYVILEAINQLPQKQREYIINHWFLGRAQTELAISEGVTAAALSNRQRHAFAKLRSMLADFD